LEHLLRGRAEGDSVITVVRARPDEGALVVHGRPAVRTVALEVAVRRVSRAGARRRRVVLARTASRGIARVGIDFARAPAAHGEAGAVVWPLVGSWAVGTEVNGTVCDQAAWHAVHDAHG